MAQQFDNDNVINYAACHDCADIVIQGYSDGIEDTDEHQARCNWIDKVLPYGYYWLESREDEIGEYCEFCNAKYVPFVVSARAV